MGFEIRQDYDSSWIDAIFEIHNKTEMKRNDKNIVDKAFANSYMVISCWFENKLVGFGRMLSDGVMNSAIYDVIVDPEFQNRGIGKKIIKQLVSKAPNTCVFLTSTFGNENFYLSLGFKKHRTGMAIYPDSLKDSPYLEH